jgi:hypothetical protein
MKATTTLLCRRRLGPAGSPFDRYVIRVLALFYGVFLGAICNLDFLSSPSFINLTHCRSVPVRSGVTSHLGAMRFPDSGKFPDLFHYPKILILGIGNLAK